MCLELEFFGNILQEKILKTNNQNWSVVCRKLMLLGHSNLYITIYTMSNAYDYYLSHLIACIYLFMLEYYICKCNTDQNLLLSIYFVH